MNRDLLIGELLAGGRRSHSSNLEAPAAESSKPLLPLAERGKAAGALSSQRTEPQVERPGIILYSRLTARAAETEARLEQHRLQLAEMELAECTFTPRVRSAHRQKGLTNTHQRLYEDAQHRRNKISARISNPDPESASGFDARRVVAVRDGHLPLHKRISSIQKAKRDKRLQLRIKHTPASSQTATRSSCRARTYTHPKKQRDTAARLQALRDKEMQECTFTPAVSAVSRQLVEASGKDFWQRNNPRRDSGAAAAPPPPPQNCTFRPDIGNAKQILAISRPQVLLEDQMAQATRLSAQDAAAQDASRAAAQALEEERFPFKPHIDAVSHSIAPPSNLDVLSAPKQPSKQQQSWAEQAAERQARECTFAPHLNASTRRITSQDDGSWKKFSLHASDVHSLSARISEMRSRRDAAARRSASRQAFAELKECTFRPRLTRSKPQNNKPVIVSGLGNHLRRHAGRQVMQPPAPSASARPSITKAAPFRLS